MADSTDEEQLNNPANIKPGNPADEIISAKDTKIIKTNQEIENMEVHHHPQVEKKNFKEYFLEFLMIFLAVTLGFFAENIREHFVNSEKEKNYMEGMLQDLEKDTAGTSGAIVFQDLIIKKMDSALNIPAANLRAIPTQDTFFHHFFYAYSWVGAFNRNDITIAQLKNAGGFSVIRNKTVVNAISELNSFYEFPLQGNISIYTDVWKRLDEFAMQLIRLPAPPSSGDDPLYYSYPHHIEVFTRYDTPLIEQLYSFIQFEKSSIEVIIENEKDYGKKAAKLIELIKKEYNLADK